VYFIEYYFDFHIIIPVYKGVKKSKVESIYFYKNGLTYFFDKMFLEVHLKMRLCVLEFYYLSFQQIFYKEKKTKNDNTC